MKSICDTCAMFSLVSCLSCCHPHKLHINHCCLFNLCCIIDYLNNGWCYFGSKLKSWGTFVIKFCHYVTFYQIMSNICILFVKLYVWITLLFWYILGFEMWRVVLGYEYKCLSATKILICDFSFLSCLKGQPSLLTFKDVVTMRSAPKTTQQL